MDLKIDASAIVALVAAGVAAWQAYLARSANKSVLQAELRATRLAVVQMAKDCEATASRIRSLQSELQSALRISQARRGIREDGLTEMLTKMAVAYVAKSEELCTGLPSYLPPKVEDFLGSIEVAHSALVKITTLQKDLQKIRDDLQSHLDKFQG